MSRSIVRARTLVLAVGCWLFAACASAPAVTAPVVSPVQAVPHVAAHAVKPPRSGRRVPLPAVLEAAVTRTAAPVQDGLQGAWARVFLRANPGPFQYVAYEITARGDAGVMSHLRGMMGRRDAVIRTELVSRDRLRAVFAELKNLDAAGLRPPVKPVHVAKDADDERRWPDRSRVPVYELSYRYGGIEQTVVIAAPYRAADPRYARFINVVRAAVIGRVGHIGYHGTTGAQGPGYLYVDSVPTATVTLDGVELPNKTPVLAFPARPGVHVVVLENKRKQLVRTFKVRIRAGRTTSLEVDLR